MNEMQHNIQQTVTKTGLKKIKKVVDGFDDELKRNKEEVKIIVDIFLVVAVFALVLLVFNVT